MEIVELVEESLYAIKYDGFENDEFTRLFLLWTKDKIYLEAFFEEHLDKLNNDYWRGILIEDAIKSTIYQARNLGRKLLEIAERGRTDRYETLSILFKPLHNTTTEIETFEQNKAKSELNQNWLRIYAIRIDANLFVITGGAIKLSRTMNEEEYLLAELKKMEVVKAFLQDDENAEDFEIFELFL
jgi:hypothetical protein